MEKETHNNKILFNEPTNKYRKTLTSIGRLDNSVIEKIPSEENINKDSTEPVIEKADGTCNDFRNAMMSCFNIFSDKLKDYGPSWRIMRPMSVTDQMYIKASRIRNLEETGISAVGEGILPEFQALVNYGIVGLIQLKLGYANNPSDISNDDALTLYKQYANEAYELMLKKNADYNEAWKLMRVNSYTDFILMKIFRVMEIEAHDGKTIVSEPISSNYFDIINYAVFGIIKLLAEG